MWRGAVPTRTDPRPRAKNEIIIPSICFIMDGMINRKYVRFLICLAIVAVAAVIGSLVTFPNITGWYAGLNKPFFSPPNWLFGPAWTLLYVMMAVSLYMVWNARYRKSKQAAFLVFGVQLVLNTTWSVVFFGLQSTWGGVGVIVAMWLAIGATIWLFWPISRAAAYLLVPYLLWVSFATGLNISVAILNPAAKVDSYDKCTASSGSVILTSYPSLCLTPDGQRFTNPNQVLK